MDYGMVNKIEKAKRYAEQRERISFKAFTVEIQGENSPHTITYQNGQWDCDCRFFKSRGVCSHTMALERVLHGMLAETVTSE